MTRAFRLAAPMLLFAGTAMAQGVVIPGDPQPVGELTPLTIVTATGEHMFEVEVVDTPQTRAMGLMFRQEVPQDTGMLFVFQVVAPVAFWMRNTYVSLDIIFIGDDGRVVNVAENAATLNDTPLPSGGPVEYVLEVAAGTAERIGLEAGDLVIHQRIGDTAGVPVPAPIGATAPG